MVYVVYLQLTNVAGYSIIYGLSTAVDTLSSQVKNNVFLVVIIVSCLGLWG